MKFILIALITGSTASGPTVPVPITAEFDDLQACEAAAKSIDQPTRGLRVIGSPVRYVCVPKASTPP